MAYMYKYTLIKGKGVYLSKRAFASRGLAMQAMVNAADKYKALCGRVVVLAKKRIKMGLER